MRKVFSVFLMIFLIIIFVMPVMAMAVQPVEIMPTSVQKDVCTLCISGVKAEYNVAVKDTACDEMTVTLSLQKYKNGNWKTVKSNTTSTTNVSLTMTQTKLITVGKFRAKAVVVYKKGSGKKTITYYSAVKTKD